MQFKFADSLDELTVTVHWSTQARFFALNVWGGPAVEVSREELTAFRDKLTGLLEETEPGS